MDSQLIYNFKSGRKAFSRIGLALVMFFVATVAAQIIFEFVGLYYFPDFLKNGISPRVAIIISSVTMYLIGFPVFYFLIKNLDTFEAEGEKCSFKTVVTVLVMTFSISYLGQMIGETAAVFIQNTLKVTLVSETIELVSQISWIDALIFAVIIGPFFEELLFRKLIIDRTRGYGEKLSLIFSALMFGLFHMSVQQFFYAFFAGLLYGYLYIRKGKLFYCWLLHALFNFFGSVVPLLFSEFLPGYEKFLTTMLDSGAFEELYALVEAHPIAYGLVAWYSFVTLAMSFVGIFLLSKQIRKMRFERAVFELPKDSEAMTAFVNVGVILFIAFAVLYPFLNVALSASV